jgi:carbonic anhydrase/acetyltransferase-like protein (isoleucine patch superfamily)
VIGKNCLVGAGAIVTERKSFPDRSLILGAPAKLARELTDEVSETPRRCRRGLRGARGDLPHRTQRVG